MKKSKSIISKISFSIIIYIVLLGFLSIILVYTYSSQEFMNNSKRVLVEDTTEQAKRISTRLNFALDITKTISRQSFVSESLTGQNTFSEEEKVNRLNQYSINGYYSAIYLMDRDGLTVLSTDSSFLGKNYSFRDYFTRSINGQTYIDASVGVTSGELGYYISAPVFYKDQIVGVVVTKLRENFLSEIIEIETGSRSNIFLADRNGVILYSTRKEDVLKSLGELNQNFKQNLLNSKRYGSSQLESLSYSYVQNSLTGLKKTETLEFFDFKHGEKELIGYSPILNNDFYIIVETDSDDIKISSIKISLLLASMVALCISLAVVVIFYNIRKYLIPLKDFSGVVNKIANGDYKSRIDIITDDELGQIGKSINIMAESVDKYSSELNKKVEERTKHLENLNKYMINREIKMMELKKKIKDLENKGGSK